MPSNVSFENEFEVAVTPEEQTLLAAYYKVFHVDGVVKKKEEYVKDELVCVV